MQEAITEERAEVYTVYAVANHPAIVEGEEDGVEQHELNAPHHKPRKCLANQNCIATGIFEVAGATYKTQEEAEALMNTAEWYVVE